MLHNLEVTAELKEWYSATLQGQKYFWGRVYGDTKGRFSDGSHIHTSYVNKIEEKDDCFIVITRNSVYRLWKCDEWKEEGDARTGADSSCKASV